MNFVKQIRESRKFRLRKKYFVLSEALDGIDPNMWPETYELIKLQRQSVANKLNKIEGR